ncbi:hypothetical protein BGX24_010182 [Mortierella sp. AD032]|nr:hypothetical protein BGX24_010182 [Mortierella sp. AD032]
MNKHVASITLPILYRDPFRASFHSFIIGRQRNKVTWGPAQEKYTRERLIRMLLDRLPIAERCRLPKALFLALATTTTTTTAAAAICPSNKDGSDHSKNNDTRPSLSTTYSPSSSPPSSSSPSSFDYFAQIRHLNIIASFNKGLVTLPLWTATGLPENLSPDLLTYIYSDEFDKIYHSNPFRPETVADDIGSSKESLLYDYCHTVLDQEALWCLASPIFEQLQSFTIPYMSSIKSYIKVVGRFKSLERIRFMMDGRFEGLLTSNDYHHHHGNNSNTDIATATLTHNGQVIQDMFRFVQEHARLFPGRLRNVFCLEEVSWGGESNRDLSDQIRQDLYRFLPPLHKPIRLGVDNWDQFMAHAQSTDLTQVCDIDGRLLAAEWYLKDSTRNDGNDNIDHPLLQGFRELKDLDLGMLYKGAFKWAVQEKKNMENNKSLVQIKRINITGSMVDGIDDVDNIVFAFKLIVCRGQIELDPRFFFCLPNLVSIQLADDTHRYRCQDIVPCPPPPAAHLAKLECLWLEGWAALTFDPSTLSSASSTLNRMMISARKMGTDEHPYDSDHTFIPPMNELYGSYGIGTGPEEEVEEEAAAMDPIQPAVGMIRPRWTWDWDLPLLSHLVLTSEFAFMFEFKMLSRCPSLQYLYLNICSNLNSESPFPQKTLAQSERIHLPSLTHLELHGGWKMNDDDDGDNCLMQQLFSAETGAFPNIETLRMHSWILSTLDGIIKFFRAASTTTTATTTGNSSCSASKSKPFIHLEITGPTRKELRMLGIYECDSYNDDHNNHDRDCGDDSEEKDVAPSDILITCSFSETYYKFRPNNYEYNNVEEDDTWPASILWNDTAPAWDSWEDTVPIEDWSAV